MSVFHRLLSRSYTQHPNRNYDSSAFKAHKPLHCAGFFIEPLNLRIKTYVEHGTSEKDAFIKACKENGVQAEWKYYEQYKASELISISYGGKTISKDETGGWHSFIGKSIMVIADKNSDDMRLLNLEECQIVKDTEATYKKVDSPFDPKTLGELTGKVNEAHGGGGSNIINLPNTTMILEVDLETGEAKEVSYTKMELIYDLNSIDFSSEIFQKQFETNTTFIFEFQGRIFDVPRQEDVVLAMMRLLNLNQRKDENGCENVWAVRIGIPELDFTIPQQVWRYVETRTEKPAASQFRAEESIIQLLMNSIEHRSYGRIYGLTSEEDNRKPAVVSSNFKPKKLHRAVWAATITLQGQPPKVFKAKEVNEELMAPESKKRSYGTLAYLPRSIYRIRPDEQNTPVTNAIDAKIEFEKDFDLPLEKEKTQKDTGIKELLIFARRFKKYHNPAKPPKHAKRAGPSSRPDEDFKKKRKPLEHVAIRKTTAKNIIRTKNNETKIKQKHSSKFHKPEVAGTINRKEKHAQRHADKKTKSVQPEKTKTLAIAQTSPFSAARPRTKPEKKKEIDRNFRLLWMMESRNSRNKFKRAGKNRK